MKILHDHKGTDRPFYEKNTHTKKSWQNVCIHHIYIYIHIYINSVQHYLGALQGF